MEVNGFLQSRGMLELRKNTQLILKIQINTTQSQENSVSIRHGDKKYESLVKCLFEVSYFDVFCIILLSDTLMALLSADFPKNFGDIVHPT